MSYKERTAIAEANDAQEDVREDGKSSSSEEAQGRVMLDQIIRLTQVFLRGIPLVVVPDLPT